MTIKLGLVGTGTVGGGCIDILQKHKEDFKRHYGIDVELARVCSRDPKQAEAHGVSDLFTLDYHTSSTTPTSTSSSSSSAAPRSRATWSCRT